MTLNVVLNSDTTVEMIILQVISDLSGNIYIYSESLYLERFALAEMTVET